MMLLPTTLCSVANRLNGGVSRSRSNWGLLLIVPLLELLTQWASENGAGLMGSK